MDNVINLSYEYRQVTGNFEILTPFVKDFSEIQNIIIEQKDSFIKQLSIYPQNFIVYIEQSAHDMVFRTNKPLRDNGDGTYDVIL